MIKTFYYDGREFYFGMDGLFTFIQGGTASGKTRFLENLEKNITCSGISKNGDRVEWIPDEYGPEMVILSGATWIQTVSGMMMLQGSSVGYNDAPKVVRIGEFKRDEFSEEDLPLLNEWVIQFGHPGLQILPGGWVQNAGEEYAFAGLSRTEKRLVLFLMEMLTKRQASVYLIDDIDLIVSDQYMDDMLNFLSRFGVQVVCTCTNRKWMETPNFNYIWI